MALHKLLPVNEVRSWTTSVIEKTFYLISKDSPIYNECESLDVQSILELALLSLKQFLKQDDDVNLEDFQTPVKSRPNADLVVKHASNLIKILSKEDNQMKHFAIYDSLVQSLCLITDSRNQSISLQ